MQTADVTYEDVLAAAERIRGRVHRTPVMTCRSLDLDYEAQLFFKCENLQRVGAFKARGAMNAVLSLDDESARAGVLTHSSGNHGAALALAARERGISAHVVMPGNASRAKQEAVARYGAQVHFCEPNLDARKALLERIQHETGAGLVHPYDDARIIAGQGTAMLEFIEQAPGLDAVITPVSGGGLISGTALVARQSGIEVFGVEPDGADDAARSLATGKLQPAGQPNTIADGLRAALSERTFAIVREQVQAILTVSEAGIVAAMRTVWERMKIVIEPSAAVVLAAVAREPHRFKGRRIGLILSGGNLDLDQLPWMRDGRQVKRGVIGRGIAGNGYIATI